MKASVSVAVPLDDHGDPSVLRQRSLAAEFQSRRHAQEASTPALADALAARSTVEDVAPARCVVKRWRVALDGIVPKLA